MDSKRPGSAHAGNRTNLLRSVLFSDPEAVPDMVTSTRSALDLEHVSSAFTIYSSLIKATEQFASEVSSRKGTGSTLVLRPSGNKLVAGNFGGRISCAYISGGFPKMLSHSYMEFLLSSEVSVSRDVSDCRDTVGYDWPLTLHGEVAAGTGDDSSTPTSFSSTEDVPSTTHAGVKLQDEII
jgi:hypothetical protein